jgi:hypothetical protein
MHPRCAPTSAHEPSNPRATRPLRRTCLTRLASWQAEQVKDQLLAQRAHWQLNGPVSDEHLKGMIEATVKAKVCPCRYPLAPQRCPCPTHPVPRCSPLPHCS